MLRPDPAHESLRESLLSQAPADIARRIGILDRADPEYVPSEVLASIVRARFGGSQVLDKAAGTLRQRLAKAITRSVRLHPAWQQAADDDSELIAEATSDITEALLRDPAPLTLAEVRFWPWAEARVIDFFRGVFAKKLAMATSLDAMRTTDEDGEGQAFADTIADDTEDGPEPVFERSRVKETLERTFTTMNKMEKQAVFMRLECDYDWATIAQILGCSKPTARKHFANGVEKLEAARNEE